MFLYFILQVSGKVFQMAFRERKIPFNVHGVAFYRKKVVNIFLVYKDVLYHHSS